MVHVFSIFSLNFLLSQQRYKSYEARFESVTTHKLNNGYFIIPHRACFTHGSQLKKNICISLQTVQSPIIHNL